jgi:hypothetical protein
MTRIRRINVSQVEGGSADNTDIGQIRPGGETAFYIGDNNKLTLMMFDGVRTHQKSKVLSPGVLFGSNADAGDGSTADTIKLIPDAALFNSGSDQYIVVDPTEGGPGHIHLRAGGIQDQSGADLYLGGELTFVRVSDTSDDVVIRTNTVGEGYIPHSWIFSNNGNLTLPNDAVIRTDGSNVEVGAMTNFNVEASGVVNIYTDDGTHQWQFGDDGSLTVPGAITQGDAKLSFNENNSTNVYLTPTTDDTSAVFINAVGSQVYGKETVSILGGAGVQAALDLFLENRQLLRDLFDQLQGEPGFPWGITQPAGGDTYDELLSLPADTFPNQATAIARANSLNQAYSTYQTLYDNSEVTLAVGDKSWRIDSEGFLNAPNQRFIRFYDGQGAFNGAIGGDNLDHVVFAAGENKGIKVFTDDGTKLWTFGTDGSLTLPAGGDILDSNGDSVLGGGDATGVSRSDDNLIIRLTDPNDDGYELRNILVDGNDANVASTVLGANGFVISTNSNVDQKQWQFGNAGGLTFPDTTVQTTAYTGTGAITFTANEIEGNTFGGAGTTFSKSVDKDGSDYSTGGGTLPFINMGADSDVDNIQVGWIVTFASGETRTVASEPYKPLGTYWFIGFNSSYSWSAGDVMPITFSSPDYVAGTDPEVTLTAGTQSWTFDDAGTLTLPGTMTIETAYGGTPRLVIDGKTNYVDIRSDGNILIGYNESGGNVFIGNGSTGLVDILGPKFRVQASVPTSSTGADGDQAGQIAVGGGYLYVCTANWVSPGTANIWTRTALTTGAW